MIQMSEPFLFLLRCPGFLGRRHVIVGVLRDLLETTGRIYRRGGEAIEPRGLDYLRPLLGGDRHDVVLAQVPADLLEHPSGLLDQILLHWMVPFHVFELLLGPLARTHSLCPLSEGGLLY